MFIAMMLLSTAALQQPVQEPAAEAVAEAPKPKKEKIVCKTESKTGSRVNFRQVCHTEAEWAMIRGENRKVLDKAQRERGWYEK